MLPPNDLPLLYISIICRLRYNQGARRAFSPDVEATNKALSPHISFFDCLTRYGWWKWYLSSKMLFGQQAAKIAQKIFINNLLTAFCCCDHHLHLGKIHRNRMPDRQKIPDNSMEDGIRRSQQQGRQQLLLRRPRVSVFVFRRILANYFLPPNFLL